MNKKYTAYTEAVYNEQPDSTCNWVGRVYLYTGANGPIEVQDGVSDSRSKALLDVKAWSENILEGKYKVPEPPKLVIVNTEE